MSISLSKTILIIRTGRKKRVAGALPFGWERKVLNDGKIVYVDHENHRTTFADPRLAFAVETNLEKEVFRQRFDARFEIVFN
jgi:WW domain-containing oxidoreductase